MIPQRQAGRKPLRIQAPDMLQQPRIEQFLFQVFVCGTVLHAQAPLAYGRRLDCNCYGITYYYNNVAPDGRTYDRDAF